LMWFIDFLKVFTLDGGNPYKRRRLWVGHNLSYVYMILQRCAIFDHYEAYGCMGDNKLNM